MKISDLAWVRRVIASLLFYFVFVVAYLAFATAARAATNVNPPGGLMMCQAADFNPPPGWIVCGRCLLLNIGIWEFMNYRCPPPTPPPISGPCGGCHSPAS